MTFSKIKNGAGLSRDGSAGSSTFVVTVSH
jgi:hypothetical protein